MIDGNDWLSELARTGWEPERTSLIRTPVGCELLSQLRTAAADDRSEGPLRRLLLDGRERGVLLTKGFPRVTGSLASSWIGERLVWWPVGIPRGQVVAVVSSRLLKRERLLTHWTAAMRVVVEKLSAEEETLITAPRTMTAPFVRRIASSRGMALLHVSEPSSRALLRRWLWNLARQTRPASGGYSANLSPPLRSLDETTDLLRASLRDRILISLADRIFVIHLRRGGQLERLVRARCAISSAGIELAGDNDLIPVDVAHELRSAGCSVYRIPVRSSRVAPAIEPPVPRISGLTPRRGPADATIIPIERLIQTVDADKYLTHCTRQPRTQWPDETEEEFIDGLMSGREARARTPLDALARIVHTQKLVASTAAVRGKAAVVCFTEAHPGELAQMRVFRRHRCRWDFLPYGICICKDWLQTQGTSAVIYGDESTWKVLPAEERPFFQRRYSRSKHPGQTIDWSIEREWRKLGDLDLSSLGPAKAFAFVPTLAEAKQLAAVSRWPVVVLASAPESSASGGS